jgi:hypothetical protein
MQADLPPIGIGSWEGSGSFKSKTLYIMKTFSHRRMTIKPAESAAGLRKSVSDSETEDILRDPIIMKMLESADRQYEACKAIPLSKLINDLGFEEDEL